MNEQAKTEALDRCDRSEAILAAEQVPINEYLPLIETEEVAKLRSREEIAHRCLCLLAVGMKGLRAEQSTVDAIVEDFGLAPHLSLKERAFVASATPSRDDIVQFSWCFEAAWAMLWALGYVDKLEKPVEQMDPHVAIGFISARTHAQFLADAQPRELREVLDHANLIYRYHWAVVDARFLGKPTPAGLNGSVTVERHKALNWLISYEGEDDWDEVATDT